MDSVALWFHNIMLDRFEVYMVYILEKVWTLTFTLIQNNDQNNR